MEVGEEAMRLLHAKRPNSHGQINYATSIYKNVILPLIITKMLLWDENVGPMTWTG